jgi:uncharacterized protein YfaS (alpha-2-macroglobulin family)
MKASRLYRLGIPAALLLGLLACNDGDTTTAPGAIANVTLDAPDSVRSGESFTIDVSAVNVGINNVHNGRVEVTLPAPLLVNSVGQSSGTTATFSNGSGATVSWNLNTLDSNSQSRLHINATGTLPGSSAAQTLTLRAAMTADGIRAGDATAQRTVLLMP